MTRWIPYALVAIAAVLAVASAVIWMTRLPEEAPQPEWLVHAESPMLYGVRQVGYSYGGLDALVGNGWIDISWTPGRGGAIDFRIEIDEGTSGSTQPRVLQGAAALGAESSVFEDRVVLGGTGLGLIPLPETHALLAADARFEIAITAEGRTSEPESVPGWWMVADALRRTDGAIRQSGLIYSPLLRDQSGFSDATRTEVTLILGDREHPVLQAVFSEIRVAQSPSRTTMDQPISP